MQPPTPSSSNEALSTIGYELQFYCGGHGAGPGLKRRDSREETLATIMRQRSAGEQVGRKFGILVSFSRRFVWIVQIV